MSVAPPLARRLAAEGVGSFLLFACVVGSGIMADRLSGGNVATQPNKWERDVGSHGTHVTSTILGYSLNGVSINGVAPKVAPYAPT